MKKTKRTLSTALKLSTALVLALSLLPACSSTKTVRNDALGYSLAVPKAWSASGRRLTGPNGSRLMIRRLKASPSLKSLASAKRKSLQRLSGFSTEGEAWPTINGNRSWRLIGGFTNRGGKMMLMSVIVDAGSNKYNLDFRCKADTFSKNKAVFNKIVESLTSTN